MYLKLEKKTFSLNKNLISLDKNKSLNSHAPDKPDLAHQKYPLHLTPTDIKILSIPQDDCGSHNNFMKFFSKNDNDDDLTICARSGTSSA